MEFIYLKFKSIDFFRFEPTHGIVFIASTNRPEILDPAVIRPGRIDKKINVPLPDKKGRKEVRFFELIHFYFLLSRYLFEMKILQLYLSRVRTCEEVDVTDLASITIGLSGKNYDNSFFLQIFIFINN